MSVDSLWGEEFTLPEKETKKIINKISKPKEIKNTLKVTFKSKKLTIDDKLSMINENVNQVLGKQKNNILVIRDLDTFKSYIDKVIDFGKVALDTETNNSLDPITCKLMGLCLYVPGEKQVYVPVNHVNKDTNEKLADQLTESEIAEQLKRLVDHKVFIIMHNGKFDYQVIKCTCGVELTIDWDTLIGAKLLDENERSAGLKEQYISKIDPDQEKYSIDHLFEKIDYAVVDPNVFAMYAATDSMMTYKLYEYQLIKFTLDENKKVYHLFQTLEMPLVKVIAEMELNGMEVDQQYAVLLSNKYNNELKAIDASISDELDKLKDKILAWKLTPEANEHPVKKSGIGEGKSKAEQLEDPINMSSPVQLAILFYDILKCPSVSKKSPRGTGEPELKSLFEKTHLDLCNLILKRREKVKLLSTYVDTIPELAKRWPDGRVRTHFNQYGAATGRLSSSEPLNFQNIPSHEKRIRLLFKAKDGYRIIGSDYSGQEVRLTAFYSQDPNMINAYKEGKDLYAMIASLCFNKTYEECLQTYPDGTIYEEGKARRSDAKSVLLGLLYGRGAASIGEQTGKSREEAQEIMDKFFKAFPKVKEWIDQSIADAHKYGYVEDIAGRRRRLPDILLPKYDIKDNNTGLSDFNPFLICKDRKKESKLVDKYLKQLEKVRSRKEYESIQKKALDENIEIHDNTGFVSQAERQAVNSRVQGGAATLTKQALIDIYNDKKLKELGAYLINTVHDEILIEAPEETAEEASKRLTQIMIDAAKKYVYNVPMECDPTIETCWYLTEFFATIQKQFKELITKKKMTDLEAFEYLCNTSTESTREQLYEIVHEQMTHRPEGVIAVY